MISQTLTDTQAGFASATVCAPKTHHDPRVDVTMTDDTQSSGELRVALLPTSGAYAYIDVIYSARNLNGGQIVYSCGDFKLEGKVLDGGRRSHSLAIPLAALRKNRIVNFNSTAPLAIESAVLRRDYYDFMGIQWANRDDAQMARSEQLAMQRTSHVGPYIMWFVTWKCNFTCAYCWQEVSSDQYRRGKANRIEPEVWVDRFHKLNPTDIYFTGGEPTLYKKLPELISMLDPKIRLTMTSNFSRTFVLERFQELVKPDRFSELTFSMHPTQFGVPEFFEKLTKMKSAGWKNVGVEMVLYPQNLQFAGEVLERAFDLQVSVKFDPYVPAANDPAARDETFMAEMRKWVDRGADYSRKLGELQVWDFNKPQYGEVMPVTAPLPVISQSDDPPPCGSGRDPIFCPAGSRRVTIDELGDVYSCMSAVDRSKLFDRLALPHYTPLGNLFQDGGFQMLERPIPCWESFRCSACDFQVLDIGWTKMPETAVQLPLPE